MVTGVYEAVPLEEADRSVRSFEVNDEQRLLTNTVVDFLNREPSVDLRQRGQSNIQTDVSIRGATFGQTLVLLNGFRMNDAQSGHHNMDLPVPLESVDRIEVLKGSGSTLYGSDAIGGVVQLITRVPSFSQASLRGALGNFGTNQQRIDGSMVHGNWTGELAGYRDFSTGFAPNRDYRNLALSASIGYESKLGLTSVLMALGDKPFGGDQFYGNFNSWERTKTWFASIRQTLGSRTTVAFGYRRHSDLFVLFRDQPERSTNRHIAENYQANFRRWEPLGSITSGAKLHWGLEGYGDSITSNNLGNHSRGRGAGYAAFDMRALKRFSFSIGGREELYAGFGSQFSPTASAGVWLTERWKLHTSASRAFRIPTYTDLYYSDPRTLGNPNLKPESAWSYEAGADWNAGGKVRGSAVWFQRREHNGIDYVRRPDQVIGEATNYSSLQFNGAEVAVVVRAAASQVLEFRYTGIHGGRAVLGDLISRYTFNYASNLAVAGWTGSLPGGITARFRVGATQRYGSDPYGVADIYVARTRGRWKPFVQLTNFTDTTYQEVTGVPMPGRGILAGMEVQVWRGK